MVRRYSGTASVEAYEADAAARLDEMLVEAVFSAGAHMGSVLPSKITSFPLTSQSEVQPGVPGLTLKRLEIP